MKRIHEFEALRGLLALWVVVGHVLRHSGYEAQDVFPFGLLAKPGLPVDVFIVLSGFVIFNLLDTKDEGYWAFILRRFFRLYPLYVFAMCVGVLSAAGYESWIANFPWQTKFIANTDAIAAATVSYLPWQTLAHLTMLHGLVPDSVLPFSQYAIAGQAWSISVEWQFYLVAPFLLLLLRRSPIALAFVVCGMILLRTRYWLGEGFAINQADNFVIGIVCYFIFKFRRTIGLTIPILWLAAAVAALLIVFLSTQAAALVIWVIFFASAMQAELSAPNLLSQLCQTYPLRFLGRISYSVYLCHMFVIAGISTIVLHADPQIEKLPHVAILMPATLLLTLLVSTLTFYAIEQPGMRLGQRLSDLVAAARSVRPGVGMTGNAP
jgi:peptidoglycan/LPS O-acetylase OafA/YrhL